MQNDPYSPCPCGSGKKFKWCCQPIHAEIAKIFTLDEEGQHEAALRAMEDVVVQHAANPEAHGRKAQLLFQNDKVEEAEKALDKAFEQFPNYPFGFFLKARFRLYEGEIAGALMLLRKAAGLYDSNAVDIVAQIHVDVFDCEMKLNHPIAARAAAELALKLQPSNDNLRQGLSTVFSKDNPNLPMSAWESHAFKPLGVNAAPKHRASWDGALKSAATGKLADATKAFEQLTQGDAVEPAAWFNLGLCHAWSGNNASALAALDQYVTLETDEAQAAQAWAIAEVLRYGQGMEDQADLVEHSCTFGARDPRAFVSFLGELEKEGLLTGARVSEEEGVLRAIVLEPPGPALTPEIAARQNLKSAAYVAMMGNFIHLTGPDKPALEKFMASVQQKLGNLIVETQSMRGPAKFVDALAEGVGFPRNALSNEDAEARVREGFEKFYEDVWIHRPLKSLSGLSPIDAAGQGVARKKLRGLLKFMGEIASMARYPYEFDRLGRKLGLGEGATPAAVTTGAAKPDITALGATDLASLSTDGLSNAELESAYQTAIKLDAREVAGRFAAILVGKPSYPERPDRLPLFQLLINQSMAAGDLDTALNYLNDGERDDCESNEGKRRNDYELRRAQLHAKRGEFDDAQAVFVRLIARVPTELSLRVTAAETMLSARQKDKAFQFAKDGHTAAIKANNRDLEGHFKELMAAAQRN